MGLNNWTHFLICAAPHTGHQLSSRSEISLPITHRHTHTQQQHAATGSISIWRWSLHNIRSAFYTCKYIVHLTAGVQWKDKQSAVGVLRSGCNFPAPGLLLWDVLWCVSQWLNISSQNAEDTVGRIHIQWLRLESRWHVQVAGKRSSWSQPNKTPLRSCRKLTPVLEWMPHCVAAASLNWI